MTPAIPPPPAPVSSEGRRVKGAFNLEYEDGYIDMESVKKRPAGYVEFWVKLFPNPKYLSIVRDRNKKCWVQSYTVNITTMLTNS